MNQSHMYLFDVDGPIVEPKSETVTHPEILEAIVDELKNNRPIALITGRGVEWLIIGRGELIGVVTHIESLVTDRSLLNNLFVSAEFGGATITYQEGKQIIYTNQKLSLPLELLHKAEKLVNETYHQTMTIEPKETQFTAKIQPFKTLENNKKNFSDFQQEQREFSNALRDILIEMGIAEKYDIHQDRIATNIRDKSVNKIYATQEVLSWLRNKNFHPEKYVIFADSKTDFEMAEALISDPEIQKNQYPVTIIFLGSESLRSELPTNKAYHVEIYDNEDLTQGTVAFLTKSR